MAIHDVAAEFAEGVGIEVGRGFKRNLGVAWIGCALDVAKVGGDEERVLRTGKTEANFARSIQ